MEKYSQFRDRATGIAPFLPVVITNSAVVELVHSLIFIVRLPFFLTFFLGYFIFFHWLPLPVVARKMALWGMMAIPGIWWVDIQLDGVKRGTLSEQPRQRVPHPGSIIAANFTSPIDAIYLSAIFDPVFTASYPGTRRLQQISLLHAVFMALMPVNSSAPDQSKLVDIKDLLAQYPNRVIAVFPECGTTNGKAILPFSPSLLQAPADVRIFPVSIRYTPPDITTPVPGQWVCFLWKLLSRPTTCVRVRIADSQMNRTAPEAVTNGVSVNRDGGHDDLNHRGEEDVADVTVDEQRFLDQIGETLARLSRVKRVALTMRDKAEFVEAWNGEKSQ